MIKLKDYYGDVNVGFYGVATDRYVISSFEEDFSEIFKVPAIKLSIAESELVGLFSAGNSNGIVLPKIVEKGEVEKIKETGINVLILKEKFTAVGNLICVNDKGALVSDLISKKSLKEISECLCVEVVQTKIANIRLVGSVCFTTNRGTLIHRDANEEEIDLVRSVLKTEIERSSINFGSPFVKSGIIANSHGALIGSKTSGHELDIILRTLKLSVK